MLPGLKPVQWTLSNLIPKGATQLALAAGAAVTKQILDIFLAGDVQTASLPAIDFAAKETSNFVQQNLPQATWDVAHPRHHPLSSVAHSGAFALKHTATPTLLSQPKTVTTTTLLLILVAILIIVASSGGGFVVERLSQMPRNNTSRSRPSGGCSRLRPSARDGSSSGRRVAGGSGGGGSGGGRRPPQAPRSRPVRNRNYPTYPDGTQNVPPGRDDDPPPPGPPSSTTTAPGRDRAPGPLELVDTLWITLLLTLVSLLWPGAAALVKRLRNSGCKTDTVSSAEGVAGSNSTAEVAKPELQSQCTNTLPLPVAPSSTPTDDVPPTVTVLKSTYTMMRPLITPGPEINWDIDYPEPEAVQTNLNAQEIPLKFTLLSPSPSTSYPLLLLLLALDFVLVFVCTISISLAPPFLFYLARYLLSTTWADVWLDVQLCMQLFVDGDDAVVEETWNGVWRKMFQDAAPTAGVYEKQEPASKANSQMELVSIEPQEQEIRPTTPVPRPEDAAPTTETSERQEPPRKARLRMKLNFRPQERKLRSSKPVPRREPQQSTEILAPEKEAEDLDVSPPVPTVELEKSVELSVDEDPSAAIPSHKSAVEQTIESPSTEKIECDEQAVPTVSISEPEYSVRSLTPAPEKEEIIAQEEQVDKPAEPIQSSMADEDADYQQRTPPVPSPEPEQGLHGIATAAYDEAPIAGPSSLGDRGLEGSMWAKPTKKPTRPRRKKRATPFSVSAPPPENEYAVQSPPVEEQAEDQEAVFLPQAELAQPVPSPAPEREEAMAQWDLPQAELVQRVLSPVSAQEEMMAQVDYEMEPTPSFWTSATEEEARDRQLESSAPEPMAGTVVQADYTMEYTPSMDSFAMEASDQQTESPVLEPMEETAQVDYTMEDTPAIEDFGTQEEARDSQTEYPAPESMLDRPVRPLPKKLRPGQVIVSAPSVPSEPFVVHVASEPMVDPLSVLADAAETRRQELDAQDSAQIPEAEPPRIYRPLPKARNIQPHVPLPLPPPAPDLNAFTFIYISNPAEKVAEVQGGFSFGDEAAAHTVVEGRAATDVAASEARVNEDTEDISREDNASDIYASSEDESDMEEVPIPEHLAPPLSSQSEDEDEYDPDDYSSTEDEDEDENTNQEYEEHVDYLSDAESALPRTQSLDSFLFKPRQLNREEYFPFREVETPIPVEHQDW